MPFTDIVTTNYDTNLTWFLAKKQRKFVEITSSYDMKEKFDGRNLVRLFYLHGKVGQPGPLVFDKLEYARLANEDDGLLDYVTFLLRDSHVIFVGFSLDDLSFNLMDSHLQMLSDKRRPESFAFLKGTTATESREWADRNIRIIEVNEYRDLPRLFEHVNTIRQFIDWAEPKLKDTTPSQANPNEDRSEAYIRDGLESLWER